jgi:hypothetical protein
MIQRGCAPLPAESAIFVPKGLWSHRNEHLGTRLGQIRPSFIAQNQNFPQKKRGFFATNVGKTLNLIPRCQENAYILALEFFWGETQTQTPDPSSELRALHSRSRNPGSGPARIGKTWPVYSIMSRNAQFSICDNFTTQPITHPGTQAAVDAALY